MTPRRSLAAVTGTLALLATPLLAGAAPGPTAPGSAAPALPPAAPSADPFGPQCSTFGCFDYVYGRQTVGSAFGAGVNMLIAKPKLTVARTSDHSLQELSLQSADRKQTVEIGWTVDPGLNGDDKPHLFVFHWIDGKPTCYNGCGFVQMHGGPQPGMTLTPRATADFSMEYTGGSWWLYYNSKAVGHFPGTLWQNRFSSAQIITAFGEVAHATKDTTCEQMGVGEFGHGHTPSFIRRYVLYGSTAKPSLTVADTSPNLYDHGAPTPTSFFLGGPGTGPCTS